MGLACLAMSGWGLAWWGKQKSGEYPQCRGEYFKHWGKCLTLAIRFRNRGDVWKRHVNVLEGCLQVTENAVARKDVENAALRQTVARLRWRMRNPIDHSLVCESADVVALRRYHDELPDIQRAEEKSQSIGGDAWRLIIGNLR